MKHTDSARSGVNRRGFFTAALSGLGAAAVVLNVRKARAKPTPKGQTGPTLYRRTEETERYFKSMF